MKNVNVSCPKCGSKNVRPITYGMDVPAEEINGLLLNAQGEVMGGCLVDPGTPVYAAYLNCGHLIG